MYKIYGALSMKHFARVTCLIPMKTHFLDEEMEWLTGLQIACGT